MASNIVHRLRTVGEGSPGRWAGWHGEGGGLAGSGRWDSEGGRKAGFSTFHIRRGDFQYTRVRHVFLSGLVSVLVVVVGVTCWMVIVG